MYDPLAPTGSVGTHGAVCPRQRRTRCRHNAMYYSDIYCPDSDRERPSPDPRRRAHILCSRLASAPHPPKPAYAGTGCYQRVSSYMANCHISTLLLELVVAAVADAVVGRCAPLDTACTRDAPQLPAVVPGRRGSVHCRALSQRSEESFHCTHSGSDLHGLFFSFSFSVRYP